MGSLLCPTFSQTFMFLSFLFLTAFSCVFFLNQFHSSDDLQNAQDPKIYDFLSNHHQNIAPWQFFKGVVHEPPWSPIVWLLYGFSIVSNFFSDIHVSVFPFLNSFFLCILSQSIPFFWWSSKCSRSQNIWFLIKPPLKHCNLTIFQGSSPWATLIPNSMIVVWVLYCVQLFLRHSCFCLSFS